MILHSLAMLKYQRVADSMAHLRNEPADVEDGDLYKSYHEQLLGNGPYYSNRCHSNKHVT